MTNSIKNLICSIKLPLFLLGMVLLSACPQHENTPEEASMAEVDTTAAVNYPESLQRVFDAHGGLEAWQNMQSLYFEIVNPKGNEKHYIQLHERLDRVENNEATMGFDGSEVWLIADTTSYKRDPVFYHNLMFYFYAMPFVLGDPGIKYQQIEPLSFEGVNYPGVGISYDNDVGASSKDQYFIYLDPKTSQMAWLGYTVTYFSGEASDDIHWIRYDDWKEVSGLKLPNSISWYKYEEGLPTELRNTVEFAAVSISTEPHETRLFAKPEQAITKP